MDATTTTVAVAQGPGPGDSAPARFGSAITTDKAAGAIVLGALAFLVVLRRGFKGAVY